MTAVRRDVDAIRHPRQAGGELQWSIGFWHCL
jgi:hypothetical protein